MDEQNKLISHLVLLKKIELYFLSQFLKYQNLHGKCATKTNRDQCEVIEPSIKVPELFHDPYLFEKFEVNQLSLLVKETLNFYKEQLKFTYKDKVLAFYFFEHRNLFAGVKGGIKTVYNSSK